jgi:hypothetical protein
MPCYGFQVVLFSKYGKKPFPVQRDVIQKYSLFLRGLIVGARLKYFWRTFPCSPASPGLGKTNIRGCGFPEFPNASELPALQVTEPLLDIVLDYFGRRFNHEMKDGEEREDAEEDLKAFDSEFLTQIEYPMLFNLMMVRYPCCLWAA